MHTVKGFGIVNKAEIDVFLELSCLYRWNITFKYCESWFGTPTIDMILYINYVLVTQPCPILCNPVDCSPLGSSVPGILTILLFFLKKLKKKNPRKELGTILYSNKHYLDYNGQVKEDLYFGVPVISGSMANTLLSLASTGSL